MLEDEVLRRSYLRFCDFLALKVESLLKNARKKSRLEKIERGHSLEGTFSNNEGFNSKKKMKVQKNGSKHPKNWWDMPHIDCGGQGGP